LLLTKIIILYIKHHMKVLKKKGKTKTKQSDKSLFLRNMNFLTLHFVLELNCLLFSFGSEAFAILLSNCEVVALLLWIEN